MKKLLLGLFALIICGYAPLPAHAQTTPITLGLFSSTGYLYLGSAVGVAANNAPAGEHLQFWVYIPASSTHAATWHEYYDNGNNTQKQAVWLDTVRNASYPNEFPTGLYYFDVYDVNRAAWAPSISWSLSDSPGFTGVPGTGNQNAFNPWGTNTDGTWSVGNQQWNKGLCESAATNCDIYNESSYGEDLAFQVKSGEINLDGTALFQNLNGAFTIPNPGDSQGGFTQLVVEHDGPTFGIQFYVFNDEITYCTGSLDQVMNREQAACRQSGYASGTAFHQLAMEVDTNRSTCKDMTYNCLRVYFDGTEFAEERMINGGVLTGAYIQNESYASAGESDVFASQLNWQDYSISSRQGPLNVGLYFDFDTTWTAYQATEGGPFYQYYWNSDPGTHLLENIGGQTNGVYCGAFSELYYPDAGTSYTNQSSGDWGIIRGHC